MWRSDFLFPRDFSLENPENSHLCSQLALLNSYLCFFSFSKSLSLSLCTVFVAIPSNIFYYITDVRIFLCWMVYRNIFCAVRDNLRDVSWELIFKLTMYLLMLLSLWIQVEIKHIYIRCLTKKSHPK